MIDTDAVLQDLKVGITDIVKQAAGKYVAQAEQDINDSLANAKILVAKWAQELNEGKEFDWQASHKSLPPLRKKQIPHREKQQGCVAGKEFSQRLSYVNRGCESIQPTVKKVRLKGPPLR